MSNFKTHYQTKVVPQLTKEFGYKIAAFHHAVEAR